MQPLSSRNEILLECTHELLLLRRSLVSTMTELAAGIDPFEIDLLECAARGVHEHGLAESHDALLHAWNGTLQEDVVVLDNAVAHEAAHTDG